MTATITPAQDSDLEIEGLLDLDQKLWDYAECWEHQKALQKNLIDGTGKETIIFCQHPPTITLGRSSEEKNLLYSRSELEKKGVSLFEIERGGDVTFHGPGQLVMYLILDLNRRKRDVHWYMRTLEEIVIRTLTRYGLAGFRIAGKTGVWIPPRGGKDCKIAAQGVKISRWCTMHGLSLNVRKQTEFSLINPCGMADINVVSIEEYLGDAPPLSEVARTMLDSYMELLGNAPSAEQQEESSG